MLQLENDPEIWPVSQTVEAFTRDEIASFIVDNNHDLFLETQLRYIIVLSKNNIQIGCIDLFNYDAKKNNAGVGITLLKQFRGKKYSVKSLQLLIDIVFNTLKLNELYCNIFTNNIASIKLFESVGFDRIKLLKANTEYMDVKYDEYFYILKK